MVLQGSKGMEEGSGGSRTSSVRSHQGHQGHQGLQVRADGAAHGPGHPAWPSTSPTHSVKNKKETKAEEGTDLNASRVNQGQSKTPKKDTKQTNPTDNLPDLPFGTNEKSMNRTEANPDNKDKAAMVVDPQAELAQQVVPPPLAQTADHQSEQAAAVPELLTENLEPPLSLISDCGDSGISASNDSQYYAKMTIIDDTDSLDNSTSEEQEQDFERQKYVRSISEPPQAATLSLAEAATPVRKLSECEQRSNKLTGLFFQV